MFHPILIFHLILIFLIVFQVLTVFHPHGLLPSALTASTVAAQKTSNSAALSTLSVSQYGLCLAPALNVLLSLTCVRYTAMQRMEAQFTHLITVARCYEGTTTPVTPGFVPAGAMLPLPR
jgi:hypothetical protein